MKDYRSIKVPLRSVLLYPQKDPKKKPKRKSPKNECLKVIEEAVIRVNTLVTRVSEFLHAYYTKKSLQKEPFPPIDLKLIRYLFTLFGIKEDKRGAKPTLPLSFLTELTSFYTEHFKPIYPDRISLKDLNYILVKEAEQILTTLETNLKVNFPNYVNRYVNIFFQRDEILKEIMRSPWASEEKKAQKYEVLSVLKKIKDQVYQENTHILSHLTFPLKEKRDPNLIYSLKRKPQAFLPAAFLINREIEVLGKKPYQIIPQRTNLVPRYITLDTSGLLKLLGTKEIYGIKKITDYSSKIAENQEKIWEPFVRYNHLGGKKYRFNFEIKTDGVACNLLFKHRKSTLLSTYERMKGKKTVSDQKLEEKKIPEKLTDLENLNDYKPKVKVGIDPGKKDIISASGSNGEFLRYSQRQRNHESLVTKSRRALFFMKTQEILDNEALLSRTKRNTFDLEAFFSFLDMKEREDLASFYRQKAHRAIRLRTFIYRKKSEMNLLNRLEKTFGRDAIFGLGDWAFNTHRQLQHSESSLNQGLISLLRQRFEVVSVDEYRTSQIYSKDHKIKLEKACLPIKRTPKGAPAPNKLHSLLTFQREDHQRIFVNRDRNASQNILNCLQTYISEDRKRPEAFTRISA